MFGWFKQSEQRMSMAKCGRLAFTSKVRTDLALFKYTKWAANLTQDELLVALWAVGEFGGRSEILLERVEKHKDELFPGSSFPRARVGLQVLCGLVHGKRFTSDEVACLIRDARDERANADPT